MNQEEEETSPNRNHTTRVIHSRKTLPFFPCRGNQDYIKILTAEGQHEILHTRPAPNNIKNNYTQITALVRSVARYRVLKEILTNLHPRLSCNSLAHRGSTGGSLILQNSSGVVRQSMSLLLSRNVLYLSSPRL